MMDEQSKKTFADIVKNEFPAFIQMLERNLDFNHWGFARVFSGVGKFTPVVIYASEACRVMFAWRTPDHLHDSMPTMQVYYGRLHAPNDEEIITWNGRNCYCWHDVEKALYFLDGVSPDEVAKNKFGSPNIWRQSRESSLPGWTQQEYMARMHAALWKHYGQRLFDLFDLRQPVVWEQYSLFLAEYERLEPGFTLSGYPGRDKIC